MNENKLQNNNIKTAFTLKLVSAIVWISAIVCLALVFKAGFSKKYFSINFGGSQNVLLPNSNTDSTFLQAGELNFSEKTSFVVDALRYQGKYEQLPETLDINKDRQKLYRYIFQQKNKLPVSPQANKPSEDFSIRSISTP